MAGRMRVVVAHELRPAGALRTMRSDQRGGIDLEMPPRLGVDVGDWAGLGDATVFGTQQQAAAFARRSAGRFAEKCGNHVTCDFEGHAHVLAVERGESIIEGTVPAGGQRLDKALAEASGLSRERIKALLAEGRVALAGKPVTQASLKPPAGLRFAITVPDAAPAEAEAQDIPLAIAYEDEDLIVVDKPAGLVVHPAAGNLDGTLVNALLHHCRGQLSGIGGVARPGIVHRIDKDTSGLLVVAKTDAAHEGLARQFADHSIERIYAAIVAGTPIPAHGTVRGAIARSTRDRKKMAIVEDGRGKHAVTHYRTVEGLGEATLVDCRLETGRTHQVRVHMSSIGHPLLGDPAYGRTPTRLRPLLQRLEFKRQALHARELGFVHPVSQERMHFASPIPADLGRLIEELRH